jgi:chemotaxis protein MotA
MNGLPSTAPARSRWQWGSLLAALAGGSILLVIQWLDGGTLHSLLQWQAALIVLGGTAAATLVSYSPSAVLDAIRSARDAFRGRDEDLDALSTELVALAIRAHRGGLLALETELERVRDPFLRNGLTLIVDGASSRMLREALRIEQHAIESRDEIPVRIVETAAGYAPTLGILGAVLGLMRVMDQLSAPAALGAGMAAAFVATVYGLGLANLVLLPVAGRLRERIGAEARRRDLITEALLDVQRRLNPRLVAQKTRGFASNVPHIDDVARLMARRGDLPRRAPHQ